MSKVPQAPEINIGMVGHVDHGKTTLTNRLTGEWTDRHSEEVKRGISIKLGYADAAFYKCESEEGAKAYTVKETCEHCGRKTTLLRTVSFVDAPGHETLMATMLTGASVMDGAILLIAANEKCPQPQTKEHLVALEISGIDRIVVVQNKIDLVTRDRAVESFREIKQFLKGTIAERAPVIPVSAHHDVNVDALLEAVDKHIPTRQTDAGAPVRMYVSRSFDINRPGLRARELRGGVFGGSLIQGTLRVGDRIEIAPGRRVEEEGRSRWENLETVVTSLMVGGQSVEETHYGGLMAVGTSLDPSLTKADSLVGRMLGQPGSLPALLHKVTIETHLLDNVVGAGEEIKVDKIRTNELLMLSVGAATNVGTVRGMSGKNVDLDLKMPLCAEADERVALSRRFGARWRLIGHGLIIK
ncbi:MAG TPA: translation initiation factor IF-2 subunit gamma [Candidatus Thermoplasmatota archaeon]